MDEYNHLSANLVAWGKAGRETRRFQIRMTRASFRLLPFLEGLSWADIREKLETIREVVFEDLSWLVDDEFFDWWASFIVWLLDMPKEYRETVDQAVLADLGVSNGASRLFS